LSISFQISLSSMVYYSFYCSFKRYWVGWRWKVETFHSHGEQNCVRIARSVTLHDMNNIYR
jgi:hypothetical protein